MSEQDIHWVRPDLALDEGDEQRFRVRIRYRQPLQDASVLKLENGLAIVFDEAQRGVTPRQFAAWYAEDELVGSGVIAY